MSRDFWGSEKFQPTKANYYRMVSNNDSCRLHLLQDSAQRCINVRLFLNPGVVSSIASEVQLFSSNRIVRESDQPLHGVLLLQEQGTKV